MSLYTYYYTRPSGTPIGGATGTTFDATVLGKSPSGYWLPGTSAGTVSDEVGSVDFTWTGSPTTGVTGIDGTSSAATLAATPDYLSRTDNAIFDHGTNDFTLMCAVKLSAWPSSVHGWLYGHDGAAGSGSVGWYLNHFTTDTITLGLEANTYQTVSPVTIADSTWHLLIVAVDRSGNATLYVDDNSGVTVDVSADVSTSLTNTTSAFWGARNSADHYLVGSLDKCAVWTSTLLSSGDRDDIYGSI